MALSYSLHLSAKGHALSTTGKVAQVSRHNLRAYKSTVYNQNAITVLQGSESILNDVKRIYDTEFGEAIAEYNVGKRPDRQIGDYLRHCSDAATTDVAVELILQVGDSDFWKEQPLETRRAMVEVYRRQLEDLKEQVPELRIASAIVHDDEASPHAHIIAVPIAEYSRGLRKRVSKTKVFTRERLAKLQTDMREAAEQEIQTVFPGETITSKAVGRNRDLPKRSLESLRKAEKAAVEARAEAEKIQQAAQEEAAQTLSSTIARAKTYERAQKAAAEKKAGEITAAALKAAEVEIKALKEEKESAREELLEIQNDIAVDGVDTLRGRAVKILIDRWLPEPAATQLHRAISWITQQYKREKKWPIPGPNAQKHWPGQKQERGFPSR